MVDAQGQLVRTDAKSLLGVTELDTVYAKGTARIDENKNLTVKATAVFARNKK